MGLLWRSVKKRKRVGDEVRGGVRREGNAGSLGQKFEASDTDFRSYMGLKTPSLHPVIFGHFRKIVPVGLMALALQR